MVILILHNGYMNLSLKNNQPINIHVNDEDAFRCSCANGHINIAQWLYELGLENNQPINIHANNEDAFRCSCKWSY